MMIGYGFCTTPSLYQQCLDSFLWWLTTKKEVDNGGSWNRYLEKERENERQRDKEKISPDTIDKRL